LTKKTGKIGIELKLKTNLWSKFLIFLTTFFLKKAISNIERSLYNKNKYYLGK
jgi:hypothetical protein